MLCSRTRVDFFPGLAQLSTDSPNVPGVVMQALRSFSPQLKLLVLVDNVVHMVKKGKGEAQANQVASKGHAQTAASSVDSVVICDLPVAFSTLHVRHINN